MIAKNQKLQSASQVAGKAAYLVEVDPRHDDYEPGERVALIKASNAMPILPGEEAPVFGEQFAAEIENWTIDKRGDKEMPKNLVQDWVISFHPDDNVTPEKALEIAEEARAMVMPGERSELLAVHVNTEHMHVHGLTSTTDENGKIWNPNIDYRHWEMAMEELEIKYDLTRVENRIAMDRYAEVKAPSGNELQMVNRTGEPSTRMLLQELIGSAMADKPDFETFAERLDAAGVVVKPNVASTGRVSGASFAKDGEIMKGSDLGKKFTWGKLSKALGYEEEKHHDIINDWAKRSEALLSKQAERGGDVLNNNNKTLENNNEQNREGETDRQKENGFNTDRTRTEDYQGTRSDQREEADFGGRSGKSDRAFSDSDVKSDRGFNKDARETTQSAGEPGGTTDHAPEKHGSNQEAVEQRSDKFELGDEKVSNESSKDKLDSSNSGGAIQRINDISAPSFDRVGSSSGVGTSVDITESDDGFSYFQKTEKLVNEAQQARAKAESSGSKFIEEMAAIKDKTMKAVMKMLDGLGHSSGYEIGVLMPERMGKDDKPFRAMQRHGWVSAKEAKEGKSANSLTREDIAKLISKLKAANAKGSDIYIRPAGESNVVLVDDLDKKSVDQMRKDGLDPSVVNMTSPGNYQVWVRVSQTRMSNETRTKVGRYLAKKYGGDPNSIDHRHFGRLPGFTNRKPEYEKNGRQPFVLNYESDFKLAKEGPMLVSRINDGILLEKIEKAATKEKGQRVEAIMGRLDIPAYQNDTSAEGVYLNECHKIAGIVQQQGWELDWSRIDYQAAKNMLSKGYSTDDVMNSMERCSPEIDTRKAGHVEDYVRRTVSKAANDPGVVAKRAEIERETAQKKEQRLNNSNDGLNL